MKILIVIPNDTLGGAEQYLKMIASYYAKKGADINIYFFMTDNTKQWNDLKSISNLRFMSKKNELNGLLKFSWFILKNRPKVDYIFTSHIYINSLLGLLRKIGVISANRLISRESTSVFLRYKGLKLVRYKIIYQLGYKNIDLLICQTQRMKDQLKNNFMKLGNHVNIKVIPNPINLNKIINNSREELNIKYNFPYAVSAGRLIHVKGFDVLIKAFSKLKKDFPELKLLILGQGLRENELVKLASFLDIKNDVIFAGHVDNVYPFFKHAKLCVVSSRIEGFPNVLLQMMSQNINIVSTTCAGGIDSIDGIYTCESNDINSLFYAMQNCLKNNNQKNKELFEAFLQSRDIGMFIETVERLIQ